jgi:hypothetical protein
MRISTVAAALAVSAIVTIPLAGIASAGGDRNCSEFGSHAEAQQALDDGAGSKSLLDPDGDGVACKTSKDEDKDKDDTKSDGDDSDDKDKKSDGDEDKKSDDKQVTVVPKGSVDTGDGSSDSGQTPAVLAFAGAAALGLGAVAARRAVRSSR